MHSIKMVTAIIIHSQCLKNSLISHFPEKQSFQTSALSPTVRNDASQSTGLVSGQAAHTGVQGCGLVGWRPKTTRPRLAFSLFPLTILHRPAKLSAFLKSY